MSLAALRGATLILPQGALHDHALVLEGGRIADVTPDHRTPPDCTVVELPGGCLLPGFIDTQVNGGGDVLFNDRPDVEAIRAIAAAHRRFGTTGLLPTLISDRPAAALAALEAVDASIAQDVPGVLGVHLEGPHLNAAKRGIHDDAHFTRLDEAAVARLSVPRRGVRMVTLAPELAPPGAIRALCDGGVVVSAGHSTAGYDETRRALDEGLSGFTHLFNAMTSIGGREPGMVGAALDDDSSFFGLIVDGVHVHPATLRIALAARGCGAAMLVTDAMPPVGGRSAAFTLPGRTAVVRDGVCRGPDGTLAGSALSMIQAVRNAMDLLGSSLVEASVMASGTPAAFLGLAGVTGRIEPGLRADLVHLDGRRRVTRTWIGGELSEDGEGA